MALRRVLAGVFGEQFLDAFFQLIRRFVHHVLGLFNYDALFKSVGDVLARLAQGLVGGVVLAGQHLHVGVADGRGHGVGILLGELGDPRFPVSIEEWQHSIVHERNEEFGSPNGYWCYVRPGTYQIGGWEQDKDRADITLPAFWIARFPITVAQYAPFVAAGYGKDAERWWTKEGWQWKQERKRTQPWRWDEPPYDGPNQPVIGVTWYEARAFCAWLTEQMQDALPNGYVIRLPTEAEWEVAAAYDAPPHAGERGGRWPYPWGAEAPTPEHAIYDASNLGRPAPVGCCPAGSSACGALDMAGNVWEVTTSSHGGYPAQSGSIKEDFTPNEGDVPWRGASWWNDSTDVRCGARNGFYPDLVLGFRVVAAPPRPIADIR